jgi:SAM-dependent methyltransferase
MTNDISEKDASKLLSIVITGRDDDYMPDFLYRITTTINFIARNLYRLGRLKDVEIVVVDWGSGKPMSQTLNLSRQAVQICRFLYIPPELIKEVQNGKDTFHPAISVNAGIRKSSGNFVMLSAADTIFTPFSLESLLKLLEGTYQFPMNIEQTYFICPRQNVPWQFVKSRPTLDEWEKFLLTTAGEHNRFREGAINSISSAAGSIIMHKLLWHELRGLDEKLSGWGFNDIDLSLRASQKYAWLELTCIGVSSFHMSHIPYDQRPVAKQNFNAHFYRKDIQVNDENWGLNKYPLQLINSCSNNISKTPEGVSKLSDEYFSVKTSQELQAEIQNNEYSNGILKNIHFFDYAWNLQLPIIDIEPLLFLSWYSLLYNPQCYVQYGINQNNIANIFAVAQYCPSTEIYALSEWSGLDSEPTPVRIASKLSRETFHRGYIRFINGDLRNAIERLRLSFIGIFSVDLAFIQCFMNSDDMIVQISEIIKIISPGGVLIINCLNNNQLRYLLDKIKPRNPRMTFIRSKKGKVILMLNAILSDKLQTNNEIFIEFTGIKNYGFLLKLNISICLKSIVKIINVMMRPSMYPEYFKNLHKRIVT